MTFSILARDPATGCLGAAAATGNLCVGGWVLRGERDVGVCASQGLSPSPFWGPAALAALREGCTAREAVARVVAGDAGAAWRQLAVLDAGGGVGTHDGAANRGYCGARVGGNRVVAGNWLAGPEVLQLTAGAYEAAAGEMLDRLVAALESGAAAGGDARGLMSAAVLVLGPGRPPLDLRVDYDPAPLAALRRLIGRVREEGYQRWLRTIPTAEDPDRAR